MFVKFILTRTHVHVNVFLEQMFVFFKFICYNDKKWNEVIIGGRFNCETAGNIELY